MHKNKLIRFAESFILLPIFTLSLPFGPVGLTGSVPPAPDTAPAVSSQNEYLQPQATLASYENAAGDKEADDAHAAVLKVRADAIDAYFRKYGMPLEGTGAAFAKAADDNDLDWRLLPAISVIETTGGENACPGTYKRTGNKGYTYNVFGWGSCKITFSSYGDAITTLAVNLSGNDKDTAMHYQGKTIRQILEKYNPPSIVPDYADRVMQIMHDIGAEEAKTIPNTLTSSYAPSAQTG